MANRQSRRAAVSKRGKKTTKKNGATPPPDRIQLTAAQKKLIDDKRAELNVIKQQIADLEGRKTQLVGVMNQRAQELNTLVGNSLQAHGVDLSKPGAGRYELDLEQAVAVRVPDPPQPQAS